MKRSSNTHFLFFISAFTEMHYFTTYPVVHVIYPFKKYIFWKKYFILIFVFVKKNSPEQNMCKTELHKHVKFGFPLKDVRNKLLRNICQCFISINK